MKLQIIEGHEVKTNLGENYSYGDGNNTATMDIRTIRWGESEYCFVARLALEGYKHITLKRAKTSVRGYTEIYALVK